MSSIKQVIEILASSDKSFEDALQRAVQSVSSSIPNISSIYVKDQSCKVRDNRIVEYRVTAKVSFGTPTDGPADLDLSELERTFMEAPVPAGNGAPDYSHVAIKTEPELPREVEPGGSATEPASGGGYSG
jgi:flavin-binding protein dodecin